MSNKAVLATLAIAMLLFSCRKGENPSGIANFDDFIARGESGLFGYGGFLFKYTPQDCQISINVMRKQIRLQNDLQTNWVHIHLTKFPSVKGEKIELEMRYKAGGDEIVTFTTMETVKVEEKRYWLWDYGNNMGIILPYCW